MTTETVSNPVNTGKTKHLVQIEHNGPNGAGLSEWDEMDPAKLERGTPVQHGHLYDELEQSGYLAGVWLCTAFDDLPGPYPVDEYMLLLEGQVIMSMPDGSETIIDAGEAFIIPKGLECQWKMPGTVRKIFMILEKNLDSKFSNPSLTRVSKPDIGATSAGDGSSLVDRSVSFVNADARMQVETLVFHADATVCNRVGTRAIVTVLHGTLATANQTLNAGESFYLNGSASTWLSGEAGTRFVQASFTN